jgi:hypothetical protein
MPAYGIYAGIEIDVTICNDTGSNVQTVLDTDVALLMTPPSYGGYVLVMTAAGED